ncbi:MAG: hypothetical protein AAF821_18175 [Cyanobacteria bacterium P01_D01_bin.156]
MINAKDYIKLNRKFVEISEIDVEQTDVERRIAWGQLSPPGWSNILAEHRVVILSSAGSGKTREIYEQCRRLKEDGKYAFFIRLEYLASEWDDIIFEEDFGDIGSLSEAVTNREEIWIFLDSIDEARLRGPEAFEKALKRLAPHIRNNLQNTHIILTSRIGAWRPENDLERVRRLFPYTDSNEKSRSHHIKFFTLHRLTSEQISLFIKARNVPNFESLSSAIVGSDLEALVRRPKDLEDIIAFWEEEGCLGTRREIIDKSIKRKLVESDQDRAESDPLTPNKALSGSKKLAASVVLTHQAKILVSNSVVSGEGFSIQSVLEDWETPECSALLARPIFEPEVYGFVRFDHRDSKEYLAAQWCYDLIQNGQSRMRVEKLFFKNQYGIDVVVPSMRPILPWLAIFDQKIRTRVLENWPEILLEGGDPASLPTSAREALLQKYCARYAVDRGERLSFDFNSLQRLVSPELSSVIRTLYKRYVGHDDIKRLLLKSIEIGRLSDLADIAITAAKQPEQSPYTRLAAMRAVTTVCDHTQIASVCDAVCKDTNPKGRRELSNIIEVFGPEYLSSRTLMSLIANIKLEERYSIDSLNQAMQSYVKTCASNEAEHVICEVASLIQEEPFIEKRFFEISKRYAWMLEFAIPACERLVEEKHPAALDVTALCVMSLASRARDYNIVHAKTSLSELIPQWRELNSKLFWSDVKEARKLRAEEKSDRLTNWWQARAFSNLWAFEKDSLEEIMGWIQTKELQDDKLVALTLAFKIYIDMDRPPKLRRRLWKLVEGNKELSATLKRLLNPPQLSDAEKSYRRSELQWKKRQKKREEKDAEFHAQWREALPNHIDQIRELTVPPEDHYWTSQQYLFNRMRDLDKDRDDWVKYNWADLIPEVGQDVAEAMRDGLMKIWRRFNPTLVSEAGEKSNSTPDLEIMGLSGLEIEYRESENWPCSLSESDTKRAARYLFSSLNGFPRWFEQFEKTFPEITRTVFLQEIEWDLFENPNEKPSHYVLSDIAWHAPWFGDYIAPDLLNFLQRREPQHANTLSHALTLILKCEAITDEEVADLCVKKLSDVQMLERYHHLWYAAWVSVDPTPAIAKLSDVLATLEDDQAVNMAIDFINALYGSRHECGISVRENYKTASHLKDIYFLMHKYIRREDDIDRMNSGCYTPTSRDNAQDARNNIYKDICDIPGKEAFDSLSTIAREATPGHVQSWMFTHVIARAQADADDPLSILETNQFAEELECTPSTPRKLFDVAVNRLNDLKYDFEDGDFSTAEVVRKTNDEEELRNYLAARLIKSANGRYSISQEDEMPNQQRTDIRFVHSSITGMVPVELKIADKGWSGTALFDKLRDQLVGDYLRDKNSENGIYLLVYRGEKQKWQHPKTKSLLSFEKMVSALQEYAGEIISTNSGISNIEVIGIDLKKRMEIYQN